MGTRDPGSGIREPGHGSRGAECEVRDPGAGARRSAVGGRRSNTDSWAPAYYFGPGHTNGDAIVVFQALRVAHAGDPFARNGTPLIDTANGGSGVAYPETLRKAAAGIPNVDSVITGHSDVMTWSDFVEYGEFNREFLSATEAAIKAGKSADDAVAGFTMPEKFKDYAMAGLKDNVTKIYAELKE